jgi:pyruvate/2-oxoglutarate dehydrogenase complex dihydrolipoamide dehydrogenase (E3) component
VKRYDLVVVGGGTAGMTAAVGAAGVGARVLLAEQERTGGDCLWTGCVPSKSLIAAARRAHDMRTADRVGLSPVEPEVDLERVMDRVHDVIATIGPHDSPERLRAQGVEVVQARASFERPGVVRVGDRPVRYRAALVATGSTPALPPVDGLAEAEPLTSDSLWGLRELPQRLVVLGGGPIGCELGQAFARLGSHVTIVEMADRLLPPAEPEAGELVAQVLRREGVDVRTATRAVRARQGELVVAGSDGTTSTLAFERLLVGDGRSPRTA